MPRCRRALVRALLTVLVSMAVTLSGVPATAAPPGDWSVIAHRGHHVTGRHARYTENTMPALKAALRAGAPAVEIDLGVTADLGLLLMHDPTLDRTTTCRGLVSEHDLDAIRRRCRGQVRGETIPTLEAVLAWARVNRRNVVLDLKSEPGRWTHDQLAGLLETVREADMTHRVSLLSFYAAVLGRAQELEPTIRTQWILGKEWPGVGFLATRADAVNVDAHRLTPDRVRALHRLGVEVFGRVANRRSEWRRLARAGVDGFLTDRSDGAVRWWRR